MAPKLTQQEWVHLEALVADQVTQTCHTQLAHLSPKKRPPLDEEELKKENELNRILLTKLRELRESGEL